MTSDFCTKFSMSGGIINNIINNHIYIYIYIRADTNIECFTCIFSINTLCI